MESRRELGSPTAMDGTGECLACCMGDGAAGCLGIASCFRSLARELGSPAAAGQVNAVVDDLAEDLLTGRIPLARTKSRRWRKLGVRGCPICGERDMRRRECQFLGGRVGILLEVKFYTKDRNFDIGKSMGELLVML